MNANIPAEAPAMDTTFNACLLEITALMILSKSTVCFGGFTISSNSSNEIRFSVNVWLIDFFIDYKTAVFLNFF